MQEYSMDTSDWTTFWDHWKDTIGKIPGKKEEMLNRIGEAVQEEIRRAIDETDVNDAHGRVKSWQNPHLGSGRGYVAVRSDSVKVRSAGGAGEPVNAGALTNYLESGHKVRLPSGRAKRYVPRARMTSVPGAHFYRIAGISADKIARSAAQALLDEIGKELKA